MDPHRSVPVEPERRIPKGVVVALVALLVAGLVILCLPFLFFFFFAVSGAQWG